MAEETPIALPDAVPGFPHPSETKQLFGQADAEQRFLEAWQQDRLHHAWLLRGPYGVGKATLAYRIARALIATDPAAGDGLFGDSEPITPNSLDRPADCPVAARISAGSEPRLFVLRRSANPNTGRMRGQIAIDDVRRLREFLGLSAADGGWRVIIVDSADEMNRNSANALLKFLEEPPALSMFLLVSHAPASLLPTIRSRCRTLDLPPLSPEDHAWALEAAGTETTSDTATTLSQLAAGSVGQALRLAAADGADLYRQIVKLIGNGDRVDRTALPSFAESCAARGQTDRFEMAVDLTQTLLARLARAAATGQMPPEAAPGEHALMQAVSSSQHAAHQWADTLATISATTRHAKAVNLDPGQTIVDMFLELDSTLGRIRRAAA
ncbi:MAG: DNA polymerase III subunit delta' [Pseudomonadota bacterium]